jgi:hypothetical protein
MYLLRVPGLPDAPAQVIRGELEAEAARVDLAADAATTRVMIEVPWSALMDPDDLEFRGFDPGDAFGFNLALSCLSEFNQPLYRAVWNSEAGYERTGAAGVLFLSE